MFVGNDFSEPSIISAWRCHHCMSLVESYPCHVCEYEPQEEQATFALKPGTTLSNGAYTVGLPLGQGGFGITYIAWDNKLDIKLAIKEYYPNEAAGRTSDGNTLAPFSGEKGEAFVYGLEKFLEEAKTVAKFHGHAVIVNVFNFFEENGTGYMVMPYIEGVDLIGYLRQQRDGRISWEKTLKIMTPVLDALREVHEAGMLHRDIKPANIFIAKDGSVKLLDFGAARNAISKHTQSLTKFISEGYSPFEQYQSNSRFGEYTDIYAVGATMYRCITGKVPYVSSDRVLEDDLPSLSSYGISIPERVEASILKAMAVRGKDRYQCVDDFLNQLLDTRQIEETEHTEQSMREVHYSPQVGIHGDQNLANKSQQLSFSDEGALVGEKYLITRNVRRVSAFWFEHLAKDIKLESEVRVLEFSEEERTHSDIVWSNRLSEVMEFTKFWRGFKAGCSRAILDVFETEETVFIVTSVTCSGSFKRIPHSELNIPILKVVEGFLSIIEDLIRLYSIRTDWNELNFKESSFAFDSNGCLEYDPITLAWDDEPLYSTYSPPEKFRRETKTDECTQVYAVAACMYLTVQSLNRDYVPTKLFTDDGRCQLCKMLSSDWKQLNLPQKLTNILLTALSENRAVRQNDLTELRDDLNNFQDYYNDMKWFHLNQAEARNVLSEEVKK